VHTNTIELEDTPFNSGAVLVLTSRDKLSPGDALSRFRRSVSIWLAESDTGRAAWMKNDCAFSYREFYDLDVSKDPEFRRILVVNGLTSAVGRMSEAVRLDERWDQVFEPER